MLDRELLVRLGWSDELIDAAMRMAATMDAQQQAQLPNVAPPESSSSAYAMPASMGFATLGIVTPIQMGPLEIRP